MTSRLKYYHKLPEKQLQTKTMNLLQLKTNTMNLLGAVHDLGAGVHEVVQLQLEQVAQAEAGVHHKPLARRLHPEQP